MECSLQKKPVFVNFSQYSIFIFQKTLFKVTLFVNNGLKCDIWREIDYLTVNKTNPSPDSLASWSRCNTSPALRSSCAFFSLGLSLISMYSTWRMIFIRSMCQLARSISRTFFFELLEICLLSSYLTKGSNPITNEFNARI